MSTFIDELEKLETPTAVIVRSFEDVFQENIEIAKEVLGSDWEPLESDPYVKNIRVLTLRQLHNDADKNITILDELVTTAKGKMLDHIGLGRGVVRDLGEYPYAEFKFTLTDTVEAEVVVPKGTILNSSDDKYKAQTVDDLVIKDQEGTVNVKLLSFLSNSSVKTENIVTDLPFIASAQQLEDFANGADIEDDDRYRFRIIDSMARISTAGSEDAYLYYTFSADSRIDDAVVLNENQLEVHIYVASNTGVDELMLKRVNDSCNAKSVRPLSDRVFISQAIERTLNITLVVSVFDLLNSGKIEKEIRANFNDSFFIGQDFIKSDLMRKSHVDGVYKVETTFNDMIVSNKEIIKIASLSIRFKGVDND